MTLGQLISSLTGGMGGQDETDESQSTVNHDANFAADLSLNASHYPNPAEARKVAEMYAVRAADQQGNQAT